MEKSFNRDPSSAENMLRTLIKNSSPTSIYKTLCINKNQPELQILRKHLYLTPVSAFKQNLKKYPVLPLKETLEKYVKTVMPFLSSAELERTKSLVQDFGRKGGPGETLQELLKKRSNSTDNWLEQWWITEAYLAYRLPVPINSSPGLVFPLQKFYNSDDRVDYAGRLIISAMKYKELIDKDKIPEEKMGKDSLDMQQYKKLFGTCRIPKPNVDSIVYNPESKHIIICSNNHFFKLDIIDNRNQLLSLNQLISKLKKILEQSREKAPALGILTSDHRDTWATNYQLLCKDKLNAQHVKDIQTSLFLVCLDQQMPDCPGSNRMTVAGLQCIHGGGSEFNSGNRWFDKTLQFVIGNDGIAGLTYEHSPSEGQPIAVMTDFIVNNMSKIEINGPQSEDTPLQRLDFNVDSNLATAITGAAKTIEQLVTDFDLESNVFKDFGKNFIKSQKLSPDSFVQMAMQLAYYRMYNKPAAHYESAHCRLFKGGRTETIRSCSVESVKFAEAMLDNSFSPQIKRQLLEAAINAHKKYTIDAINARGVDRHFLGLRKIAEENNINLHDIFKDNGFIRSKHFSLSTSQVATKCPGYMCYGAVVNDGYGICYNPRDEEILYGIGSFKSNPNTSSKTMNEHFVQSLKDMRDVLNRAPKAKM